ncbi:hypothetical protein SAMN03159316_1343 [Pseudomonas sp. NFR02]|uniref:hypothetical protein n=1 Tax=Pseudomonas sp. NFR02 TaxID=1566229 RepID=UPI000910CB44|nr:hypothetical protein [Pseudomonas sp. NFR02]SFX26687.1 hypothetical protein SAMN03159316_1343 [Pseudomonas sp. NFR02]
MDLFSIPPTVYVALGAIVAALLAGFFSYVNLVSAKENKVSEFRLAWTDGLREEVASFTAAIQVLAKHEETFMDLRQYKWPDVSEYDLEVKWIEKSELLFSQCIENMSKIHLRLNPDHIKKPNGLESKLMDALRLSRDCFNDGDYAGALDGCGAIRNTAAPLLKQTWETVKLGEPGYRKIRKYALLTVAGGFYLLVCAAIGIALYSTVKQEKAQLANVKEISSTKLISEENPKPCYKTIPLTKECKTHDPLLLKFLTDKYRR